RELRILLRIRDIAARRHIKIVKLKPVVEADRNMARVRLAAETPRIGLNEWLPRDNGHPVVALLAIDCLMNVAQRRQALGRKQVIYDLGLLQAEGVGRVDAEETGDQVQPQPDGIDVPGGDLHLQTSQAAEAHPGTWRNSSYSKSLGIRIAAMKIHKL